MIDRATDIVTLQPIYHLLNEAVLTVLGGVIIWASAAAKSWLETHAKFLDEQTDKMLAEGLNRALQNGVTIAMNQLDTVESAHPGLPVQGAITRFAAQYAIDHSPAALQRFGLNPEDLALKALAYLPTPSEQVAPPVKVDVVNVQPLPPA